MRQVLWGSDAAYGARYIEALVDGLPHDSATARSVDPDYAGTGWDTRTELLATIAELIDQHTRMFIVANSKKGARQPRPIHIPRPGQAKSERKTMDSTDAMHAMWASGVQVYRED